MNTKRTIRKILFAGLWLTIGSGMLLLLMAAIGKQKNETCKDVEISITGAGAEKLVLQEKDIFRMLKAATKGPVIGQSRKRFDLWGMEKLLETNIWVRDARVYFDNKDVLHVKLTQRQPMARVFTSGGRSFYLDESGQILHLVDQLKLSLPVITGFPERKQLSSSDSLLVKDMISLASFLQEESFWDAQIGQVNLVSSGPKDWEFELVPLIGSHLIRLGNAESMEQKFNRLYQFYRQVIPKAGWEKYKVVDIRFAGQVVAEKK